MDKVLGVLDRDGALDMDERETSWRNEGRTGYGASAVGTASSGVASMQATTAPRAAAVSGSTFTQVAGRDEVIGVYEERLKVGKREISHGRLRVRSYVVEKAVDEQVTLRTESVQVNRRPVDCAVDLADDPFQDRTIELEEFAEEAVLSKRARVVEEISLREEATDRIETIHDTVRHTEVEIDDGQTVRDDARGRGPVEETDTGRIVEHTDVIASDGTKMGTVDHMDGPDHIKLARTTSPDGQHHLVPMAWVDYVDRHVHLKKTPYEVKAGW